MKEKKEIKIQNSITLTITEEQEITVIEIKGYIDYSNYLDFQRQINLYLKDNNKIIVVCKELNFISSSGIAALIQFVKNMENKNGKVIFVSLNKKITDIFSIIKLDKTLTIFQTISQARDFLKSKK